MLQIHHAFTSAIPDGPDPGKVQASNWNADLVHSMATARYLGRLTAGAGEIEELTAAQVLAGIGAAAAAHTHVAANITDFTEAAQDAVFLAVADSNSIDVTYNDGANSLQLDVRTQMSVTIDASGVKLSGDAASPGNSKYYGTDSGGTKGFFNLPAADGLGPDGDKGDITVGGSGTTLTIDNDAVTYAKMQNVTDARILGRAAGSNGDTQELTAGFGLTIAAGAVAAALSSAQAFATAQTTISAATYADITGASVSLAAGTWLVIGQIVHGAVNAIYQGFFAITDGSNVVQSEVAQSRPASGTASLQSPMTATLCAIVSPGSTTTYKLRAARGVTTHTGSFTVMDGNGVNTANHLTNNTDKGTGIFAVRIA